jgi:dTDP-4-amino-4,6-dideoxygalactose transaminase
MKMLPRYVPSIDLSARLESLSSGGIQAAIEFLHTNLGLSGWRQATPVELARHGIATYFEELSRRDTRRSVLLSAQICPVVPSLLVALGFRPVFIDVDSDVPMPNGEQIAAALSDKSLAQSVAAAIISPIYGYLPAGLDDVAQHLNGTAVLLDLAQAVTLAPALPQLLARADASVFSFGIGKGLDSGGGLLAVRTGNIAFDNGMGSTLATLAGLPTALAIRLTATLGIYEVVTSAMERNSSIETWTAADAMAIRKRLPDGVFKAFAARFKRFAWEVNIARKRAAILFESTAVAKACRSPRVFANGEQMHLRQIVRLADASQRDPVLASLRKAGIDAMPAGEPLAASYLLSGTFALCGDGQLPNAKRFLSDAIRLPFLGRMDERSFRRVAAALENALER